MIVEISNVSVAGRKIASNETDCLFKLISKKRCFYLCRINAGCMAELSHQVGGSKDIRLRLLDRLDREYVGHYSVMLVALDGGQPQRSSSLLVNIVVTDTNDNVPQFDRSTSTLCLSPSIIVIIFTITHHFSGRVEQSVR